MRTISINTGYVIIKGAVISICDCCLFSFCPKGALA